MIKKLLRKLFGRNKNEYEGISDSELRELEEMTYRIPDPFTEELGHAQRAAADQAYHEYLNRQRFFGDVRMQQDSQAARNQYYQALQNAFYNPPFGYSVLSGVTTGDSNTFVGKKAPKDYIDAEYEVMNNDRP